MVNGGLFSVTGWWERNNHLEESHLSKAVLVVKPHVVAGLNKGGEDLFLLFSCAEGQPDSDFELSLENGNVVWKSDQEEGTTDFRVNSGEYEFTWEGTKEDLLRLAERKGLRDASKWSAGSWKHKYFVNGNAD